MFKISTSAYFRRQNGDIMNITDMLIQMAQTSDASQPSLFPFPLGLHLTFVCIGAIFFAYRFFVQKRPYQLIMAIAIAASLIIWISDNSKTLFYGVGIAEGVLILAALISSFIFKAPAEAAETASKAAESDANSDENKSTEE